jgi:hypothetical protein
LNLGSEVMHIKAYVQFTREEIVDAKYIMVELVDLSWGREIQMGSYLNEEPMKGIGVRDQPTPIVNPLKPVSMPNYYQTL